MRADNFTFRPTFKLLLYGNSKPVLRTVDDAWRRRFYIVPFIYKPPKADSTSKDRLRAEYGRILRWAIDGCRDWQQHGFSVPRCVRKRRQAISPQDTFGAWPTRCETGPDCSGAMPSCTSPESLCEKAGEYAAGHALVRDRLVERGYQRIKDASESEDAAFWHPESSPTQRWRIEPPAEGVTHTCDVCDTAISFSLVSSSWESSL
jgi:putative DNA primase/helicase